MKKSTMLFLAAIELLACSLAVSVFVWVGENLSDWWPKAHWLHDSFLLTAAALISSIVLIAIAFHPYSISSADRITSPKYRAISTLFAYWLSISAFFVFSVGFIRLVFYGDSFLGGLIYYIPKEYWSQDGQILPWVMAALSILLLSIYVMSEFLLLKAGKHWNSFTPARIILFHRFMILGKLVSNLERGWPSVAIRFANILLATWLVQIISRFIWQMTASGVFEITYKEILLSPKDPTNGSIFNKFLTTTNQSTPLPIDFLGRHFATDIASSLFSLLWNHLAEMVAVWLILETIGYLWSTSNRLVIVNSSTAKEETNVVDGKDKSREKEAADPNLAELLATKLDWIKGIYEVVDEKRSIHSACGAGEPIDAAIKVERLEDIALSSTSEIKLGPFGIPASSVSSLISHILMGPKISIGLYQQEQDDPVADLGNERSSGGVNKKSKLVLMASLSGKMGSKRWLIECGESLEGDSGGMQRSIEDMITELANRIHARYADMQSERTGQGVSWKALWNFNEGLRAYRDGLKIKKKHKYYLYRAEKKFIDALKEEDNYSLAHYNLGVVYAELNQIDSAQECFQRAIDLNKNLWEAYYALGIAIFRKARDVQQSYEILSVDMSSEESKMIKDDYEKVISLCERVLKIKSLEDGIIIEKDYSVKARSYDLMGNALARMACIQTRNKGDSDCIRAKEYNIDIMKQAEECLEKSVNYSWMALIIESVQHETAEDAANMVSECTLDLAHVYLMLSECGCYDRRPKMSTVLLQAIHINPKDAGLYYLLAKARGNEECSHFVRAANSIVGAAADMAGGDGECSHFLKAAYEQILLMNSNSFRIKAHISAMEFGIENAPASWIKSCQDCCDEATYEKIYRSLDSAIRDKDDSAVRKFCFDRDKLESDLKKVEGKKECAVAALKKKEGECSIEQYPRVFLSTLHLYQHLAISCRMGTSLILTTKNMKKLEISSILLNDNALLEAISNDGYYCIFMYAERLSTLGLIFLELAKIKADEYINSKQKTVIDKSILIHICNDKIVPTKKYKLKEYCEIFLDLSQKCVFHLRKILILANKSRKPNSFHKKEITYYLVEGGKALLEISEIRRSLGLDIKSPMKTKNRETNTYIYSPAKMFFKDALNIIEGVDSKTDEIKHNKIYLHLARADNASENLADALTEAQKAKELNPLGYEEREVLGRIFCRLKEFNYGLSELNTAITYMPDDSDLLLCTGRAYYLAGKDCKKKGEDRNRILKNARDRLSEALEIVDRSDITKRGKIRFWIGKTLLELGRYEEAIPHFRVLVKKDYNDPLPAIYLGYAFLKCNSHEECESTLYKIINQLDEVDRFYGQQYDEVRHIDEILARAYVYLAYSFAKRDANPCDSWQLAFKSMKHVNKIKEKGESWTRIDRLQDVSDKSCFESGYGFLSVSSSDSSKKSNNEPCISYSINKNKIKIEFDQKDGVRKRKCKAHLAECAGTIFYKMGRLSEAVDFLNASIALFPDAGAYINLAKAYERTILSGVAENSDKGLIDKTIRDLCRHAELLDLKDEHNKDLKYFREQYLNQENGSSDSTEDNSPSGEKKP